MNEIKGRLNVFKYVGTYDNNTGKWNNEVPEEVADFIFDLDENNICYVETNQLFQYDSEIGNFYLIKED